MWSLCFSCPMFHDTLTDCPLSSASPAVYSSEDQISPFPTSIPRLVKYTADRHSLVFSLTLAKVICIQICFMIMFIISKHRSDMRRFILLKCVIIWLFQPILGSNLNTPFIVSTLFSLFLDLPCFPLHPVPLTSCCSLKQFFPFLCLLNAALM